MKFSSASGLEESQTTFQCLQDCSGLQHHVLEIEHEPVGDPRSHRSFPLARVVADDSDHIRVLRRARQDTIRAHERDRELRVLRELHAGVKNSYAENPYAEILYNMFYKDFSTNCFKQKFIVDTI